MWLSWLRERFDGQVPRHSIITDFVKKGLIPFLESKGYSVTCSDKELASAVATVLFRGIGRRCVENDLYYIPSMNTTYMEEDLTHYYDTIDPDAWSGFWSHWSYWPDVSHESEYGWDRQQDIQALAWKYIDIQNSFQTKVLDSMLYEEDYQTEEDDYRRRIQLPKEDVYVREAAESNEWGGYRR